MTFIEALRGRIDRIIEEDGPHWTGAVMYIQAQDVDKFLVVAEAARQIVMWDAYLKKNGGWVGVPANSKQPMEVLKEALAALERNGNEA